MQFRVLGTLEVVADGAAVDLGPPKQRALLAGLLLHVGEIVPVDRLIELLWGESAPRTAAHSIQTYISELRRALEPIGGPDLLVTRLPGYVLRVDPDEVDAWQFERLVRDGVRHLDAGNPAGGRAALREALALWRGPALSDFASEEFAQPYIRRLNDLHLDAIEAVAAADLGAGRTAEVVGLLEAAVLEDPLRERSRELLMLALYRAGRPADALRTFDAMRRQLADELGVDPSPPIRALYDRILLHDPSLLPGREGPVPDDEVRNPYKGLRAFTEDDTPDFFGRDDLVAQLLDDLRDRRLVTLVGPSGSGKSSALAAGLLPRIRAGDLPGAERWRIAWMTPGSDPLTQARAAVARIRSASGDPGAGSLAELAATTSDDAVLLVIDQLEEAFTLAEDAARDAFLDAIAGAVATPAAGLRVVGALRADFYDRPLLHPAFAAAFGPSVVNVMPMSARDLEAAVVEPARRVGVEVEPALLAELVAETADRPGSLPLLQYALTELFDQRSGPALTHAAYAALGGLRGLLSRRAEGLYLGLDAEVQAATMQVFLRLVQPGTAGTTARRRVALDELTDLGIDPVVLSDVLATFGRHRLLTFDRDAASGRATVEVAHEALLAEWERLAGWIDRNRAVLRRHVALVAAADEWEQAGRDPDYLLSGSRLAEFEPWLSGGILRLGRRERLFLEAAVERRRAGEDAETARVEADRRSQRRTRLRFAGLGLVVVVLGFALADAALGGFGGVPREVALLSYGRGVVPDQIESGFDRGVSDFGLVGRKFEVQDVVPTRDADAMTAALRTLSEDPPDLIMVLDVVGIQKVAPDYPDARFLSFDPNWVDIPPNVGYVAFRAWEGAYLAGAAAALTSSTGTIGFVGAWDGPPIWGFQAGYAAGARAARPGIRVRTTYLYSYLDGAAFSDPGRAEAEARRMYADGADVVFQAAGDSGLGVFEAAAAMSEELGRHVWAIGADSDQHETIARLPGVTNPGRWQPHILTSMVKGFDDAAYAALRDVAHGTFVPGLRVFDLASGGVDISYSGGFLDDARPTVEEYRRRIVAGEVRVPCIPDDREDVVREWAEETGYTYADMVLGICP
jgi:basic membrane lipoprotein Med (substrate-binding protein (PBP1-ABC) superfamily)/DNA-binding SARP family transcriptional activator